MLLKMIISITGLLACQSSYKCCCGWLRFIPHFKLSWTKHTTLSLCMSTKKDTHRHKGSWQRRAYDREPGVSAFFGLNKSRVQQTHCWPLLMVTNYDWKKKSVRDRACFVFHLTDWPDMQSSMGKLCMSWDVTPPPANSGSPDWARSEGQRVNTAPFCLPGRN